MFTTGISKIRFLRMRKAKQNFQFSPSPVTMYNNKNSTKHSSQEGSRTIFLSYSLGVSCFVRNFIPYTLWKINEIWRRLCLHKIWQDQLEVKAQDFQAYCIFLVEDITLWMIKSYWNIYKYSILCCWIT